MLTALVALALLPSCGRASAIDLHLHLRMDAAVPGLFRGNPGDEPARVKDRSAKWSNQVSLRDLEAADVRLVMAALYTPAGIAQARGGWTRALDKQIDAVEAWVKAHPQATLVRTPEEADAVLKSKEWRLGVILAAEGSHAIGSVEKLDAFWQRGLRMVTIAHFVDSPWAGAADVSYWPRSSCRPGGKADERRGKAGLTDLGKKLSDRAVELGLIMDLTHASDKTAFDVARRYPELPLMFSHEAARELTPCERTISPELLAEVKRSRGIVGVTLSANYLGETAEDFLAHAKLLAAGAGKDAMGLGTDYNGMIRRYEGAGYAPAIKTMRSAGIPADRSAEYFVDYWRRVSAAGRRSPRPERRRD